MNFAAQIPSPSYAPDVAMTDDAGPFAPAPPFMPVEPPAFPQASHEPSPDIFGSHADLGLSSAADADSMLRALLDDTLLANMPARESFNALWSRPASPIEPAPAFDFDALETLFGVRGRKNSVGSAEATSPSAIETKLRDRERAGLDAISVLWPRVRGSAAVDSSAAPAGWASALSDLNGIAFEPIEPPSSTFLASAISSYFRHHAIESPLFIPHLFDPQTRAPILVLTLTATGARFLPGAEAKRFNAQIFARLEILLQRYWSEPSREPLDLICCAILLQDHHVFCGTTDRSCAQAVSLQGPIVARARAAGLFDRDGPCASPGFTAEMLMNASPAELDGMWKAYLRCQEARQTVCALWCLEAAVYAVARNVAPPNLAITSSHSIMPCDDPAIINATDAVSWRAAVLPTIGLREVSALELISWLYSPTFRPLPPEMAAANRGAFAARGHLAVAFQQDRCRRIAQLPDEHGETPFDRVSLIAMVRWHQHISPLCESTALNGVLERECEVTWHIHCMNFLQPLNELEMANGRDGADRAEAALARMQKLHARQPARLRRALLHAGQVIAIVSQLRSAPAFGQALQTVPFKAALLIAQFAPTDCGSTGDTIDLGAPVDWTSLGLTGSGDPAPLFPENNALTPVERWIHFGGPARLLTFGALDSLSSRQAVLRSTADTLASMGGSSRPIGVVLGSILRSRADSMRLPVL